MSNEERMALEKQLRENSGNGIGVGIAIGAALGAAYGASSGNMGQSLVFGVALGTAIGAIFDFSQRGKSKPKVDGALQLRPDKDLHDNKSPIFLLRGLK